MLELEENMCYEFQWYLRTLKQFWSYENNNKMANQNFVRAEYWQKKNDIKFRVLL